MEKNNNTESRNKTRLNKSLRNELGINARRWKCGCPVENSISINEDTKSAYFRFVDQKTDNGGDVTPFNIQCLCVGACAIKKIIVNGDETIVLFQDGDRIQLRRHESDNPDPVTAVLWALGQKVFGTDLARQINRAIKYRMSTIDELRNEKNAAKAKETEKKMVQVNG